MDDLRLDLRPLVPQAGVDGSTSAEEAFQNTTLRPVIKLQSDLLHAVVKAHVLGLNKAFDRLNIEIKYAFVDVLFLKDKVLTNKLIGVVLGQFTLDEFAAYAVMSSDLNKRIVGICLERFRSQL